MVKVMKNQRVVIVLAGRYAGRKAVVVKVHVEFVFSIMLDRFLMHFSHTMMAATNVAMDMLWSLVLLVIHVK